MIKKRITYFLIMILLFIVTMYTITTFLGEYELLIKIFLSFLIAVLSDKFSKWIVNIMYKDNHINS